MDATHESATEQKLVDFEARRLARRRIVEMLQKHQQSEAETTDKATKALLKFYEFALRELGNWLAGIK